MELKQFLQQLNLPVNNETLLKEAFFHTSYVNELKDENISDNERLELLGDAVLQLWSAQFLYHQTPVISEGDMTLIRAQLVNEKALATYSKELNLGQFLQLGKGEKMNGGHLRDSILADVFEAFLGALYLDSGKASIDIICQETIAKRYEKLDKDDLMDYKTKLQEFVQSDVRKTVEYLIVNTTGPANQPYFEAVVKLDQLILGKGSGSSKKKAQQQAAKDALAKLVK